MESILESQDFKYSVHCLLCAYEDLGYSGKQLCMPKTKSCKPVFPYDLAIQSQIRKHDVYVHAGISEKDNKTIGASTAYLADRSELVRVS